MFARDFQKQRVPNQDGCILQTLAFLTKWSCMNTPLPVLNSSLWAYKASIPLVISIYFFLRFPHMKKHLGWHSDGLTIARLKLLYNNTEADVCALIYHSGEISWRAQCCDNWSAEFPTLNRISVTVSRWRRRRDRRGSEWAAPKWVFHLYASEWLRGVLLRDKDWPPRPLQTNPGPGAACSSSAITAAPLRYNTIRTDRALLTPRAAFSCSGFVPRKSR